MAMGIDQTRHHGVAAGVDSERRRVLTGQVSGLSQRQHPTAISAGIDHRRNLWPAGVDGVDLISAQQHQRAITAFGLFALGGGLGRERHHGEHEKQR